MTGRVLISAALILVPAWQAAAQSPLGGFTGYSAAGKTVTVHAGAASVRVSFYGSDIVRIDLLPSPASVPDTSFAVIRDSADLVAPSVSETDSTLVLSAAGGVRLACRKNPLRLSLRDGSGTPVVEEPAAGGLATQGSARWAAFRLEAAEHFYGTGERGIGPDLRGEAFDSYNTQAGGYDGPRATMNINVPFLASTRGYGILFDNTYPGRFDLGASDPSVFRYRAAGGELTLYVIVAPTVREQLERYTWLTGRQPLPPRWAFGYLQSKYGYRNEAEARALVATMRQKRIPCDAIILDIYWFDRMGDIRWNPATYPDPFPMMADFLAAGIKTVTITEPYIINSSANWSEASALGCLTTDSTGHAYLMQNWWACGCPASLIDMTRAAARSWWWGKHPAFFGGTLAGIWTDLGEPERHPADMVHAMGSTARVHNVYNLLWAEAVYEGFGQMRPDRRIFNLTRSGFSGIQRYGVIPWSGDVAKSFGGLAVQVPMLLNMGMSGLAYHNSDIGGFCCGTTTPELYIRWLQYGAFCPVMRAHGAGPAVGGQNTEPWAFGPEAEAIARDYIGLRYRLLPYIYTMAHENQLTGMPLARPLFFDYPGEPVYGENSSYLWGNAFLVSPVVQGGETSKTVYLPHGTWINYWTDGEAEGGRAVSVAAPLATLPLWVKKGSIVPMQPLMNWSDERPLDTLVLGVYPDPDRPASFTLYEDDGVTLGYRDGHFALTPLEASWDAQASEGALRVLIGRSDGDYAGKPSRRVYLAEVHGVAGAPAGVRANAAPLPARPTYDELRRNGGGYYFDSAARRLYVQLPTVPDSSYELVADRLVLVGAHEAHGEEAPGFRLEQNYPNPFNPSTVIRYAVAARSRVVLKIYDVLGRRLATLVDDVKDAGSYEVVWDAAGAGASSAGIYFSRLEAGSFSATRKLILLR